MGDGGAVDLSREAIAARQASTQRGHGHGGRTGRELIALAASVFDAANRNMRIAEKRPRGSRRDRAVTKAREALLTSATQIRLAELVDLDRGYLHQLTIQQVQKCEAAARAMVRTGTVPEWQALAIDTHRRVAAQRQRARTGG